MLAIEVEEYRYSFTASRDTAKLLSRLWERNTPEDVATATVADSSGSTASARGSPPSPSADARFQVRPSFRVKWRPVWRMRVLGRLESEAYRHELAPARSSHQGVGGDARGAFTVVQANVDDLLDTALPE